MSDMNHSDLANANARMAGNVAKVSMFGDVLLGRIDELVAAAWRRDWREVGEVSEQLAESSRESGYRSVSALAKHVNEESQKPDNDQAVKRSLIRLIGTSERVGRPHSFRKISTR